MESQQLTGGKWSRLKAYFRLFFDASYRIWLQVKLYVINLVSIDRDQLCVSGSRGVRNYIAPALQAQFDVRYELHGSGNPLEGKIMQFFGSDLYFIGAYN